MASSKDPCAGCVYQVKTGGCLVCDYISITGHRRPCPFGAGCTVKETEVTVRNWNKAEAFDLYQAGARDEEIAAEVGVHRQTVRRWRMEHDLPPNLPAPQTPPAAPESPPTPNPAPEPEAAEVQDGSGHEGTDVDKGGREGTELDRSRQDHVSCPSDSGPVELHLELAGGWARIRAPGWAQAARLWRMMDVCIAALRTEGGEPPERKEG